jgi:hypothetical protein
MPGHIAVVKAECEFVHISGQMLRTCMVIDAVKATFQDRPRYNSPKKKRSAKPTMSQSGPSLRVCPVTSCGITKSSEHEAD